MTTVHPRAAISERVAGLPWSDLHASLDRQGFALTPSVLSSQQCRELARLYDGGRHRATITMARHGFGEGEYKYFDYPLPEVIAQLRATFYEPLAETANRWAEYLDEQVRYPSQLEAFLERCHQAGQTRPTPLILHYHAGDWNALHQDIYGDVAFPFQIVTVLDSPGEDFEGGELVLVEQRPRAQSRAHVIHLGQGAFLIFTTRQRPVPGRRGFYRATMRHGVSSLTAGSRTTLGIVFHDAR